MNGKMIEFDGAFLDRDGMLKGKIVDVDENHLYVKDVFKMPVYIPREVLKHKNTLIDGMTIGDELQESIDALNSI